MPGAGTDKTKRWVEQPGPVVVLVEPQLGENIGAAARAMANFGLSQLRLVRPRQAWPNEKARIMAVGADRILERAQLYDDLPAAIADCTFVVATTARAHDQAKLVLGPAEAAAEMGARIAAGGIAAIIFGRERNGLENDEVALADRIVTLPVNPAFASLNLAQAIVIVAYEWFKHSSGGKLPFATPDKSAPAPKQQLLAFFASLERELEKAEFFRPPDKRDTMQINLRNIITRMQPSHQDIQTLHGVIMAIAEGRKGPARGGILDGEEAELLRTLLDEHGAGRVPKERGPVRGLARLLRRNPTDTERALWEALTNDRRFAGRGFKRQTPIGQNIFDFVSFPLRLVIELVPPDESAVATRAREHKRAWLKEHDYTLLEIPTGDIEASMADAITRIGETVDRLQGPA
ncbi:MAG TPA: TrmJ/YjtD family RNA methyltransferase [Xanthobacteraceae bacterium]|jgi:tRNA/rRNA methyltransferase|nr:TrmJ/YjtD family RNA methyltransferase [Xanthobacteraceae bacterium]